MSERAQFACVHHEVKKNYLRACQHVIKEIYIFCRVFFFES